MSILATVVSSTLLAIHHEMMNCKLLIQTIDPDYLAHILRTNFVRADLNLNVNKSDLLGSKMYVSSVFFGLTAAVFPNVNFNVTFWHAIYLSNSHFVISSLQ